MEFGEPENPQLDLANPAGAAVSIDQHFIQAAYLKAWHGADNRLAYARKLFRDGAATRWIVNRLRKPARSVAWRTNYFTTQDQRFGPEWYEAQFQQIENPGIAAIRQLRRGRLPMGPGSRRAAARYISMSLLRSLGNREWNRARDDLGPDKYVDEMSKKLPWMSEAEVLEWLVGVHAETESLRPIEMTDALAVTYAKCLWHLLDTPIGSSLLIGDGFGIRIDSSAKNEPGKTSGMGRSEFLIPLSPTRLLVLVQGAGARQWSGRDDTLDHRLVGGSEVWTDAPVGVLSRSIVDDINICTLAQSYEYCFAASKRELDRTRQNAAALRHRPYDLVNGLVLLNPLRSHIEIMNPVA